MEARFPVNIAARLGPHLGLGAWALVKRSPRSASASMFGVGTRSEPRQPTQSFMSSTEMKRTFFGERDVPSNFSVAEVTSGVQRANKKRSFFMKVGPDRRAGRLYLSFGRLGDPSLPDYLTTSSIVKVANTISLSFS